MIFTFCIFFQLQQIIIGYIFKHAERRGKIINLRSSRKTTDDLSKMGFIYNIEQEPGKFIAEASTIYKVNDPIVSEKEDNKIFKSVEKSQGDQSQSFIKQETVLESPEPDEPTGSKLTEDLHGNSRKLSEGEALCGGPLKSLEEIDDSRTEEENEDSRKLHEHDTIIHLPNSGYTTCNSEESQKLTECEAVDPSKLAVEKGNPNVPATIVEEVSILHFISSDFKQEREKKIGGHMNKF